MSLMDKTQKAEVQNVVQLARDIKGNEKKKAYQYIKQV